MALRAHIDAVWGAHAQSAPDATDQIPSWSAHPVEFNPSTAEVFGHVTTIKGLLRWMSVDAIVELEPGGRLESTHNGGATSKKRTRISP
jgi:hypothetical protein